MSPTLLTCGHSNLRLADYLAFLRTHRITRYVDVRRQPWSRRYPHFSRDMLQDALEDAGIAYVHEEALGGHRDPLPNSVNDGWDEAYLRGYADWLGSDAFQAALARVLEAASREEARGGRLAVACAERLPKDCHRQVLADALAARGARVLHAVDGGAPKEHAPPSFARMEGGRVTYPKPEPRQGSLFG